MLSRSRRFHVSGGWPQQLVNAVHQHQPLLADLHRLEAAVCDQLIDFRMADPDLVPGIADRARKGLRVRLGHVVHRATVIGCFR